MDSVHLLHLHLRTGRTFLHQDLDHEGVDRLIAQLLLLARMHTATSNHFQNAAITHSSSRVPRLFSCKQDLGET